MQIYRRFFIMCLKQCLHCGKIDGNGRKCNRSYLFTVNKGKMAGADIILLLAQLSMLLQCFVAFHNQKFNSADSLMTIFGSIP